MLLISKLILALIPEQTRHRYLREIRRHWAFFIHSLIRKQVSQHKLSQRIVAKILLYQLICQLDIQQICHSQTKGIGTVSVLAALIHFFHTILVLFMDMILRPVITRQCYIKIELDKEDGRICPRWKDVLCNFRSAVPVSGAT